MKKILLFGTVILMATSVLAFGGGGGKSRKASVYRGTGVDSIGVHFNGKGDDSGKETCSAEKQCGDYCCKEDNVCNENETGEFQCCNESICCPADQTAFVAPWGSAGCCAGETYCSSRDTDGNCIHDGAVCCTDGGVYIYNKVSNGTQYSCCRGKIYKGYGLDGSDLCCQESETTYCLSKKNNECVTKVCCPGEVEEIEGEERCYAAGYTGCKTNAECAEYGADYFCNVAASWGSSYPTQGTCEPIGTIDGPTAIEELGEVVTSSMRMNWWAARNWCQAVGRNLIDISEFQCYRSGTDTLIENRSASDACCQKGTECSDVTLENISPSIVDLSEKGFGDFWIASEGSLPARFMWFIRHAHLGLSSSEGYYPARALCK